MAKSQTLGESVLFVAFSDSFALPATRGFAVAAKVQFVGPLTTGFFRDTTFVIGCVATKSEQFPAPVTDQAAAEALAIIGAIQREAEIFVRHHHLTAVGLEVGGPSAG